MSSIYDNWERLVKAVLKRDELRQIALSESLSSTITADFSSRFSFHSSMEDDESSSTMAEPMSSMSPNNGIFGRVISRWQRGSLLGLGSVYEGITDLTARRLIKTKRKHFLQNGGLLLEEKLARKDISSVTTRIFSFPELQKATNNFHDRTIIGQGGYGSVYRGVLPDNRIVAIKKSRLVGRTQTHQFINEVIVLSQINHRHVVKLLGCCLETRIPLLVYEFVSNGTLFEHIHDKAKARSLSWDLRLKIATETAGVLSYLHSAASIPIIHRDVKSANILLDHNFTAKVSDFGASRLFPLDQTELTTLVQGTFGYLDPEYMQTGQLTEKSDVYSFGVVLVELLTGRKAVSKDRPEKERISASFFLSVMKEEHLLFQVLDNNVVREGNKELVMKAAVLAQRCLNVKGNKRPSMKDVEMELKGLRSVGVKYSWIQTEHNAQDMESLLGDDGFSSSTSFEDTSTSIGFHSI